MKTSTLALFVTLVAACGNDKPSTTPANDQTTVTATRPSDSAGWAAATASATTAPEPTATASAAPSASAAPASTVDRKTPQAVIDAWLAAAKAGDKKAMLDLFVPEARDKEGTSEKAFTHAIADKGYTVVSTQPRDAVSTTGDEASARYAARFKDAKGKEKGESLHFVLTKKEGSWWIKTIE